MFRQAPHGHGKKHGKAVSFATIHAARSLFPRAFAVHLRCIIAPGDQRFARVFPQGFVAAFVPGSAAARLQVHQRNAVSALGDQCEWIGLEGCGDDLVVGIAVTQVRYGTDVRHQMISGLQPGDAQLVRTPPRFSALFQQSLHPLICHEMFTQAVVRARVLRRVACDRNVTFS